MQQFDVSTEPTAVRDVLRICNEQRRLLDAGAVSCSSTGRVAVPAVLLLMFGLVCGVSGLGGVGLWP